MNPFWLKKIFGALVMPLGIVSLLLVGGLILGLRWRRLGRLLVISGTCLLIFLSLPITSSLLSESLEKRYPVVDEASLPDVLVAIVVLAGGVNEQPNLPAFARLGSATQRRTLEGVRLWRLRPRAQLIMSSGS